MWQSFGILALTIGRFYLFLLIMQLFIWINIAKCMFGGVFSKLLWNAYQTKNHTVLVENFEFQHICWKNKVHSIKYLRTLWIKWREVIHSFTISLVCRFFFLSKAIKLPPNFLHFCLFNWVIFWYTLWRCQNCGSYKVAMWNIKMHANFNRLLFGIT